MTGVDLRPGLSPSGLTTALWDRAFLIRHGPGESFEHWKRVLDETVARGHNTLRIDPIPQSIDLRRPNRLLSWSEFAGSYMSWCWQRPITDLAGRWLLEFMKLAAACGLHFVLRAWWFCGSELPESTVTPHKFVQLQVAL